jgi:hypothetical protein
MLFNSLKMPQVGDFPLVAFFMKDLARLLQIFMAKEVRVIEMEIKGGHDPNRT